MPHLMTDETHNKLLNIAGNLTIWEGGISNSQRNELASALVDVLSELVELPGIDVDALAKQKSKDETLQMMMASELFSRLIKVFMNEHGGVIMTHHAGVPWFFVDDKAPEVVGIIPSFIDARDERPLTTQIDQRYHHGGGWRRLKGWELNVETFQIRYTSPNPDPEDEPDPPLEPLAGAALHGEIVVVYESGWTMVVSDSGANMEVARLD